MSSGPLGSEFLRGGLLPVHGFVLAGGASTRMGTDKARLLFRGRPLISIAVEKLAGFCAQTSIAGNRDDLAEYAPVVHETRLSAGPAAGIEAGLCAATAPWALFIPVDVPLAPASLLRGWAEETLAAGAQAGYGNYLVAAGEPQPAFCLLRSECRDRWSDLVATGQRRLSLLLAEILSPPGPQVAASDPTIRATRGPTPQSETSMLHRRTIQCSAERYVAHASADAASMRLWFSNVNTPQELARAEAGAPESATQTPRAARAEPAGISTKRWK